MPIYEYRCTSCGHTLEVIQKFNDKPLKKCTECSGALEKLISRSAFQLKGAAGTTRVTAAHGNIVVTVVAVTIDPPRRLRRRRSRRTKPGKAERVEARGRKESRCGRLRLGRLRLCTDDRRTRGALMKVLLVGGGGREAALAWAVPSQPAPHRSCLRPGERRYRASRAARSDRAGERSSAARRARDRRALRPRRRRSRRHRWFPASPTACAPQGSPRSGLRRRRP